ncbi:putative atp-binding protein [hydrocarbon metagenome]|uniref:Putative atp-binding protein n=1 Tax=hydrocarbon metagenome TaxID=938273 RepID=A0A0W8FYQ7_9ZZZZ
MNRDAELLNKIYDVTRGDLDGAVFTFPQLGSLLDSMTLIRITRLSRFWKNKENEDANIFRQSVEDLVSGFYGQSCPWMFLLKGSPTQIECWFGASSKIIERSSFRSNLNGVFPDLRFGNSISLGRERLENLKYAVNLTGIPSYKAEIKNKTRSDQIEKICRGLYGSFWLYSVYTEPVSNPEIIRFINDISMQIRNIHATYLLKGSAIDEENRIAKRLIELLELNLKRYEQGRASGMWNAYITLFTDNTLTLGRAQALLYSAFSGEESLPVPLRVCSCHLSARQNTRIEPLNSKEVSTFTCPPQEEYPGYEIVDYARFGVESNNSIPKNSKTIKIGNIIDRGMNTGNSFSMPLQDLTKHGLIVGVTGSGKTNTCFILLDQIWDGGKGIPFLVIESAKSEYRSLLKNPRFEGLKIFTVGDETVSPLRLNPFEVLKGILVQTHIDYLKSLFSAAFVLYPPMPYVLEQSIQEIYEDRGWDLARNANWRGKDSERLFPTLADLAAKIDVVVERMGYDERITMDVKAGLLARINQLRLGGGKGSMFNTRNSIDSSILFKTPCILELKQIVSDDEKAFIMGLLLIRLYEYYESSSQTNKGGFCHVTLIEEAHRLLRNVSTDQSSEVSANPRGRAIEVFANILSEIRAYGEGILMAEQIPAKLTPDAIKNTNLKIVHRLVAEDDRKLVGSTMNLTDSQIRYLTTLEAGQGIAYTEGMNKPVLLTIPLTSIKSFYKEVSNQDLQKSMNSFWNQNRNLLLPYSGCENCWSANMNRNCGVRDNKEVGLNLVESFLQLFNTFRLNKALVFESYLEFERLYLQSQNRPHQENLIYCLFVEMIESQIERRGEYWGWLYGDVQKAIDLSCKIGFIFVRNVGKTERKLIEQECSKPLARLSNLFKRLHKVDRLPYAGCRYCSDPCHFRFDMKHSKNDINANDFQSSFFNTNVEMNELARIGWNVSNLSFHSKDIRSRRGAALCFAIQQFSEMALSRLNQEEMTFQIADSLNQIDKAI